MEPSPRSGGNTGKMCGTRWSRKMAEFQRLAALCRFGGAHPRMKQRPRIVSSYGYPESEKHKRHGIADADPKPVLT